ncbi:MAG TPA: DUF302 domain-containing protein [Rhizomicrobium sp.]
MNANGLITRGSAHDFGTTLSRLVAALASKSLTIFAIIEHGEGAAQAGLELLPTTVVIFGNAAGGTPLMQSAQTAGIDLPLKMLIWQDAKGAVHLSYNDPAWIAARHGADAEKTVAALTAALAALADAAAN